MAELARQTEIQRQRDLLNATTESAKMVNSIVVNKFGLSNKEGFDQLNQQLSDMQNTKMTSYQNNRDELSKNPKYNYKGDDNAINNKPTLNDALLKDTNEFLMQENNIYILGSITIAILLIGGIVLNRD